VYVGWLGAIGILYGAIVALGQTDFKKLLAYSSVSHMGFVILGLAAWSSQAESWEWAANGAIFQMLAHGISSSALFFAIGVIYDRAHHRDMDRLGGLSEPMPVFSGFSAILMFASLGLPGLCGFVGEVLVMLGVWSFSPTLAAAAIGSTVLTASYWLRAWQKVYWGTNSQTADYADVTSREFFVLFVFVILAILLGILPGILIFQWVEPSVHAWIQELSVLRS
jgi:NADH-quinone oxidoreductase subunit M